MFETVARASAHHTQVVNLVKQRQHIERSLLSQCSRMQTLERNLLAYIYALVDEKTFKIKPNVASLVTALTHFLAENITLETLIQRFCELEQDNDFYSFILLASLLVGVTRYSKLTINETTPLIDSLLYPKKQGEQQLAELLRLWTLNWPSDALAGLRQHLLKSVERHSNALNYLVLSTDAVTETDLTQGYFHENSELALACFVRGLIDPKHQHHAQSALFQRFAKSEQPQDKARWLALAGLTGDQQWLEPASIFCQHYPQYTYEVLSHFQHKANLTLTIELMAIAQTSQAAYQTWLLLTEQSLLMEPAIKDIGTQQHSAGDALIPNQHQAELYRQQWFNQAGDCVLAGISYDNQNAVTKLNHLHGLLVQRVVLFSAKAIAQLDSYAYLYGVQPWQNVIKQLTSGSANANQALKQGVSDVA
ncbi:hypothetical protein [Thalassotalea ganghwensis]